MAKIEIGDSSVNGYDDDSLEILCERNMFGAVEKWRKKWFSEKIVVKWVDGRMNDGDQRKWLTRAR